MSETMKDTMERELQEAIAMLNRANGALERIFNTDEREDTEPDSDLKKWATGDSVGNCWRCNAWDDSLEVGICQTCIGEEK